MDTVLGSSVFRGQVIGKASKRLAAGLRRNSNATPAPEAREQRKANSASTFVPTISEPIWHELYQEAAGRCLKKPIVTRLTLAYELQSLVLCALLGASSPRSICELGLQPGALNRSAVREFGEAAVVTAAALVQTMRMLTGYVAGVLARVVLEHLRREGKQQRIIVSDGPSVLLYGVDPREILLRNELSHCWDEAAGRIVDAVRKRRGPLDAKALAEMLDRYYYANQDFNEAHRGVSMETNARLSRPQAHRYRVRVEAETMKIMGRWLEREGVLSRAFCHTGPPARSHRASAGLAD
jgi:hypothetical protein